jgi:hypothetical protein
LGPHIQRVALSDVRALSIVNVKMNA